VELPFGKGKLFWNKGGLTDKLVGGWRLSGVATLQSGLPINPYQFSLRTNTGLSIPERGDLVGPAYLTGDAWDAAVDAWEHKGQRLFLIPAWLDKHELRARHFGKHSSKLFPSALRTALESFGG
jgi:hypothetical protein